MRTNQGGLGKIIMLFVIVIGFAFVFNAISNQYALKGAIQDSGKHGLKMWYDTASRAGYPISSQSNEVTEDKLTPIEQVTSMNPFEISFEQDDALHIVPLSAPADVLGARVEALEAAGNEVVALRFDMAFDLRVYEAVSLDGGFTFDSGTASEEVSNLKIFNGFVLRNQALPFERNLAEQVTNAIDAYAKEKGLKRWVYHDDLVTSRPENRHWLQIVPLALKLLFFQSMIALLLYFTSKGTTFGFHKEDYDEIERTPAAFLIAVASYYKRYRCYDQVAQAFWNELQKLLPKDPLKWAQYAQDYGFSLSKVEKFHQMALANWPENRMGPVLKNCAEMHQMILMLRKSRLKKWHKQ